MLPRVAEIVGDVRSRGDAALLEWTELLDGERPGLRVPQAELERARLEPDALDSVRRLAEAVNVFTEPQRPPNVGRGGRRRASRAPLAPALLDRHLRARRARRLSVVARHDRGSGTGRGGRADRRRDPAPRRGYAGTAHALGIDEVYAVGGAQAVAALAYGTETIAPVDKIVGPGNRWVTAAKLLVSSHVGIDLRPGRARSS